MRKYRIIKVGGKFIIQRKFLWWWFNPFAERDRTHGKTFPAKWDSFEGAFNFLFSTKEKGETISVI
jgi:hypothetical protein